MLQAQREAGPGQALEHSRIMGEARGSGFGGGRQGRAAPTSPNRYSWRPQLPTAFMMDALWMALTGIPSALARSCRSVCVVALQCRDFLVIVIMLYTHTGRVIHSEPTLHPLELTQRGRPRPGRPHLPYQRPPVSCRLPAGVHVLFRLSAQDLHAAAKAAAG